MRDREGLFNEYILEVRRREKDEKVQKKETVSKQCGGRFHQRISFTRFFLSTHSFLLFRFRSPTKYFSTLKILKMYF